MQVNRFCPTAPGSTEYNPPTYINNPGPGTHFNNSNLTGQINTVDKGKGKYFSKQHKKPAIAPNVRSASIPAKKVSANSYAGQNGDTVGPALYNPNKFLVKQKAPINDFSTSKLQRKVFDSSAAASNCLA